MLAILLKRNREQLFSFSADSATAIYGLEGAYNKNSTPEDNVYVRGFSGDPCSVHRVSRPAINLEHPCLTLCWYLQPDLFWRMVANRRFWEGGFLVRCLFCDTLMEPREDDGTRKAISANVLLAYRNLIGSLIKGYWDSTASQLIVLSNEQRKLFRDYRNETVPGRKSELKDIGSFVGRWSEQAQRIAVGQHAALHGDQAHSVPMTDQTIQNAIGISRWFAAEQLRLLQIARQSLWSKEMEELRDLLLTKYPQGVALRTLQRSHSKSEESVRRIAKEFPKIFFIDTRKPAGGGRPSECLFIHKPHR